MVEISEKKKEEIKNESKKIIDNFASAIEKVSLKEKKVKKEVSGFREEKFEKVTDPLFRRIMFEDAPSKEGDNIIAEKKSW